MKFFQNYVNLFIISSISVSESVWKNFDLVRPWKNAWGSKGMKPFAKITIPTLKKGSQFGSSVTDVGDWDYDGINEIAVGAPGDDYIDVVTGKPRPAAGAIYILFMSANNTVKSYQRICGTRGAPPVYENDNFGYAMAAIGDMDNDGVIDLAVGAPGQVTSSVFILYMRRNATVKHYKLIRGEYNPDLNFPKNRENESYIPNGPPISYKSRFGSTIANIGDLDGDNITDLAVGAPNLDNGFNLVYILFMERSGIVRDYSTIGSGIGGGPDLSNLASGVFSFFGSSVSQIGDLNKDNITDLAVGAKYYNDIGNKESRSGAVFILYMFRNGTVRYEMNLQIIILVYFLQHKLLALIQR